MANIDNDNIFRFANELYGNGTKSKINKHTSLTIKLAKVTSSLHFLMKCRKFRIVPNFVTFTTVNAIALFDKNSVNLQHIAEISEEYHLKIMNAQIKEQFSKKKNLMSEIQTSKTALQNILIPYHIEKIINKSEEYYEKIMKEKSDIQDRKFKNLILKKLSSLNISFNEKTFKNLTDVVFDNEIKWLIGLGPNFSLNIPNNNIPVLEIITDVEQILKNIQDETEKELKRSRVSRILQNFKQKNNNDFLSKYTSYVLMKTKKLLKENDNIIIVKSDKGNVSVVMYKDDYENKMNLLVNNPNYKVISRNPTSNLINQQNKLVKRLNSAKVIDDVKAKLMNRYNFSIPRIYALPKIHKSGIPLRPICSYKNSVGSNLATLLIPIFTSLEDKYNIKNSFELKEKLNRIKIEDDEIIISLDVISLFPNIPINFTINEIKKDWNLISANTNIPQKLFYDIVHFCMKNANYFTYKEKFYEQIDGCPMGSPISPAIANFILNKLLDYVCSKLSFQPKLLVKYVDDLLMICPKNLVNEILNLFNSFHTNIQFTTEEEKDKKIPYLDLLLIRKENKSIVTDFYKKPECSGRILNYLSAHPNYMKVNTAYNFISRVFTLSSSEFHRKNKTIVYETLLNNNYPKIIVKKLFRKFYAVSQRVDYATNNVNASTSTTTTNKIYKSLTFIPTLSNKIERIVKMEEVNITFKPHFKLNQNIFSNMKDKIKILETPNVIYKIPCDGDGTTLCNKSYVGHTKNYLKTRISQHQNDLRNPPRGEITALVAHFADEGHTPNFDEVKILDKEQNYWRRTTLEALHICNENTYNFRRDTNKISSYYSPLLANYQTP